MITDLKDLTPELIADLEDSNYFCDWCEAHRELVLECMRVALRWRNDLDQMKEERG